MMFPSSIGLILIEVTRGERERDRKRDRKRKLSEMRVTKGSATIPQISKIVKTRTVLEVI